MMAGICAAKALVQLLCRRFHDPVNVQVHIHCVEIPSRRKFCVQEVLMHMCLPPFYLTQIIHTQWLPWQDTVFSLILGLRHPRDFSSLLSNTYCLNIGKINPLKHYVLSLSEIIESLFINAGIMLKCHGELVEPCVKVTA